MTNTTRQKLRIVILDRSLIDEKGHHLPYLESIVPELRRRGIEVSVYANSQLTRGAATIGAIPHFETAALKMCPGKTSRTRMVNYLRLALQMLRVTRRFYRDLVRLKPMLRRPGTVVFDPDCEARNLLGYLLWRCHDGRFPELRYVLLIRRPLKLLTWLSRLGWSPPLGLRFATDSVRIRKTFPPLDMLVLPIPHTQRQVAEGQCRQLEGPLEGLRGCRFLFLGRCRAEQGIATLVSALARLREELAAGSMCAVVQAAAYELDPEAVEACSRLRDLKLANVVLLTEMLGDTEYAFLLRWTDVVLAPYLADAYHSRTSGIVAEALAVGKPVITTSGTWMSDQITQNNGIAFDSGNPVSLASAISRAVREKAMLLQGAADGAANFAAFHNPARFVEMLISG